MIYVDRILHWQIAKIVSVNDLMQWNIVVKITNNLWKTEYPLVIVEKKYSIFRSLQDMIFKDYWYFWILHWKIAKIASLNDLMQWNIVVKITNSIWKTEYPLVIEREKKKIKRTACYTCGTLDACGEVASSASAWKALFSKSLSAFDLDTTHEDKYKPSSRDQKYIHHNRYRKRPLKICILVTIITTLQLFCWDIYFRRRA